MSNTDLEHWVTEELYWDPRLDSETIAVKADDGHVTLRGTVGSFGEKRDAKNAAQRVYGVKSVDNRLEVRLMTGKRRADADLRADVLQALMLDSRVPSTIDATVEDGWVTLSGTASWKYERDEAGNVAGNVAGVIAVDDKIELIPEPDVGDVKKSIKKALKRNAKIDADRLSVDTHHGTVTVTGTVTSWSEHDAAIDAAWAAPGVTKVEDNVLVDY